MRRQEGTLINTVHHCNLHLFHLFLTETSMWAHNNHQAASGERTSATLPNPLKLAAVQNQNSDQLQPQTFRLYRGR